MRSPSPGRKKAQAPPGKGQDLGLSDVRRRRNDYGCPGFLGSSFFAGCLFLLGQRPREAVAPPGAEVAALAVAWAVPEVAGAWLRLRLWPRRYLGLRPGLRLGPWLYLRHRPGLAVRLRHRGGYLERAAAAVVPEAAAGAAHAAALGVAVWAAPGAEAAAAAGAWVAPEVHASVAPGVAAWAAPGACAWAVPEVHASAVPEAAALAAPGALGFGCTWGWALGVTGGPPLGLTAPGAIGVVGVFPGVVPEGRTPG